MLDRVIGFAVFMGFAISALVALHRLPNGSWFELSVLLGILHLTILIVNLHERG